MIKKKTNNISNIHHDPPTGHHSPKLVDVRGESLLAAVRIHEIDSQ